MSRFIGAVKNETDRDQTADEFFQEAVEDDGPDDPNFTDAIVCLEADQNAPPESIDDPFETFDAGGGDPDRRRDG